MIISAGGRADSSQSDGQAGFDHEKDLLGAKSCGATRSAAHGTFE